MPIWYIEWEKDRRCQKYIQQYWNIQRFEYEVKHWLKILHAARIRQLFPFVFLEEFAHTEETHVLPRFSLKYDTVKKSKLH